MRSVRRDGAARGLVPSVLAEASRSNGCHEAVTHAYEYSQGSTAFLQRVSSEMTLHQR
jgi:hypothetical protein